MLTLTGEEVEETEIAGFVADKQTFYSGNTEHGQIVQVEHGGEVGTESFNHLPHPPGYPWLFEAGLPLLQEAGGQLDPSWWKAHLWVQLKLGRMASSPRLWKRRSKGLPTLPSPSTRSCWQASTAQSVCGSGRRRRSSCLNEKISGGLSSASTVTWSSWTAWIRAVRGRTPLLGG